MEEGRWTGIFCCQSHTEVKVFVLVYIWGNKIHRVYFAELQVQLPNGDLFCIYFIIMITYYYYVIYLSNK